MDGIGFGRFNLYEVTFERNGSALKVDNNGTAMKIWRILENRMATKRPYIRSREGLEIAFLNK